MLFCGASRPGHPLRPMSGSGRRGRRLGSPGRALVWLWGCCRAVAEKRAAAASAVRQRAATHKRDQRLDGRGPRDHEALAHYAARAAPRRQRAHRAPHTDRPVATSARAEAEHLRVALGTLCTHRRGDQGASSVTPAPSSSANHRGAAPARATTVLCSARPRTATPARIWRGHALRHAPPGGVWEVRCHVAAMGRLRSLQ